MLFLADLQAKPSEAGAGNRHQHKQSAQAETKPGAWKRWIHIASLSILVIEGNSRLDFSL
jgi:hypothetical protein